MVASTAVSDETQACDISLEGQDCLKYPYEICDPTSAVCVHKGVFPMQVQEIIAVILIPFLMAFASVGGIGGGAVMVPVGIAFFHFASKESIAVSAVIVLESAVIRYVFFSHWKEHPESKKRSEIDFNTVRLAYPLFLLGSYGGIMCYIFFSEVAIAVAMCTIMGGLSI